MADWDWPTAAAMPVWRTRPAGTADWNQYIASGSGAANTWSTNLGACAGTGAGGDYSTWTSSAGANESLPIVCENWYEAYAFCIWDGGFLPSEAEWGYAAAGGGTQQREYPWGSTAPGTNNQYAIYDCYFGDAGGPGCPNANADPFAPVGTATLGAGLWGQLDLLGEAHEWTLDWYAAYADPCADCAYLSLTSARAVRGIGAGGGIGLGVTTSWTRTFTAPTLSTEGDIIGLRCARSP